MPKKHIFSLAFSTMLLGMFALAEPTEAAGQTTQNPYSCKSCASQTQNSSDCVACANWQYSTGNCFRSCKSQPTCYGTAVSDCLSSF